jgi:hypothetical protein
LRGSTEAAAVGREERRKVRKKRRERTRRKEGTEK